MPSPIFLLQWDNKVQCVNKVRKNCLDKLNGSLSPPPPSEAQYVTSIGHVKHSNPIYTTVGK